MSRGPEFKLIDFAVSGPEVTLKGRIFTLEPDDKQPALLLLHGIPRARPEPGDEGYAPMARRFAEEGFAVVFFNFRGTGESTGNFHLKGWSDDLVLVLDFLQSRPEIDTERIFAAGFSGGAAAVIYTASRDKRIRAVVSVSCPARFEAIEQFDADVWIRGFREIGLFRDPGFPRSIEAWKAEFEEMAPIKWVDRISPRPLLIIHGEKDELVGVEQAEELFAKAKEPKELIWISDGPHRLRTVPQVEDRILSWLKVRQNAD